MKQIDLQLTAGNSKGNRRELDYYPTPKDVTVALMRFITNNSLLQPGSTIWEPACGEMAISDVIKDFGHNVFSSDIQTGNDYLQTPPPYRFDGIITNPPFKQSELFIKKATEEAPLVAMLLKSQYWHAKKRTSLFKQSPPAFILALNWRPDFLSGERGGQPTMEVIWTLWVRGIDDTRYKILEK